MSIDVHDDHYRLWAAQRREGVNLGYPKVVPWYVPPRLGNVYGNLPPYTDDDYRVVAQIERLVAELREVHRRAMVVHWGAYPNAPSTKQERYEEWHLDGSNCRKQARDAMRWIARNIA